VASEEEGVQWMQQILEKQREFSLLAFILFIDYEKAYDNLNRKKL
jgi:hypothetical protein